MNCTTLFCLSIRKGWSSLGRTRLCPKIAPRASGDILFLSSFFEILLFIYFRFFQGIKKKKRKKGRKKERKKKKSKVPF